MKEGGEPGTFYHVSAVTVVRARARVEAHALGLVWQTSISFVTLSSFCFPDSLKAARGPYSGRGKDYRSKCVGMPVGLPTFN